MRLHLATARRTVTSLLAVALVGYGLLVAVPSLAGYQTYAITTGSMAGTADPGSLVVAEAVPVEDLAVGDVVTYLPPASSGLDHPVTHRLVEVTEQPDGTRLMRTAGDANPGPDPWTFVLDGYEQPRMVVAVPHAGRPVLALADPDLRLIVVGGPAALVALVALVEIVRIVREPREDRPRRTEVPATD